MTSLKRTFLQSSGVLVILGLLLAGCNLPAPNVPTATTQPLFPPPVSPGAGTAVLGGRVWNDVCAPSAESPSPPECIVIDSFGNVQANGILESGEPGIAGVQVSLGAGQCPASGLASAFTTGDGAFQFAGLGAGTYCVSVSPPESLPGAPVPGGVWTYPGGGDPSGVAFTTVTLAEGEIRVNVNFGWDYREPVTPTPGEPTLTPTATVTPTPTITPTATPSSEDPRAQLGEPTWQDPFDSGGNWPLYEDTHVRFEVEDGKLVMTALNADYYDGWLLTWPEVSDFYLEMQVTSGTCDGQDRTGLMFRAHGTPDGYAGYLFAVTCDGRYSLRSWDAHSFTTLVNWTQDSHIVAGSNATNRIGVWAEGSHLKLYVNGQLLRELSDTTHTGRMFGMFIGAARTAGFTAKADEIAYWLLP